ncbi:DUF1963 domain-containing protein [Adlercreutzia sp. R25]|uniref:DUF1963 domain-containing protein n=1 Tax=Adlercreutzia shanghongiae TaxID=3111773 RepID=A0ABU6IZH6_9ACTN|nr:MULTISPECIES: DUF1963 domain-containing protein [unclassified Adlercreutzia]MEC4272976.1 DUF1963 domain-containing protein [Adlercreutzia sp. R25]MEC4295233.1 DUF1963 domain-containing protein [Adlercreutzia sp. R22]
MGIDRELRELTLALAEFVARPSLRFGVGERVADEFPGSKIGGSPLLPFCSEWPCDGAGRPLALLAQVDCSDLAPLSGFPRSGLLQFFVRGDGAEFGLDETGAYDAQDGFRVLYWAEGAEPLVPVAAPAGTEGRLPFKPRGCFRLRFAECASMQPATADDWRFDQLFTETWDRLMPDAPLRSFCRGPYDLPVLWRAFDFADDLMVLDILEVCPPRGSREQVGGWPTFEQVDPRAWPDAEGLKRYDTVLFQLGSSVDDRAVPHISWGDCGTGVFLINGDDLRHLDFSRVMYYWDCG